MAATSISSSLSSSLSSSITLDASDDFLPPQVPQPPAVPEEEWNKIAPWSAPGSSLDAEPEPPTPPPKGLIGTMPFINRPKSTVSLPSYQQSDTASIDSAPTLTDSLRGSSETVSKKVKTGILTGLKTAISRTRSRSRLRPDRLTLTSQDPVPPVPSPTVIPYNPPPASPPPTSTLKRRKGKEKEVPPPLPSKGLEFPLDTNIDNMEGIIDYSVRDSMRNGDPSSPSSAFDSSAHSSGPGSDVSSSQYYHSHTFTQESASSSPPSGSSTIFNNPNPFSVPALPQKRTPLPSGHAFDSRRIGPKQRPPFTRSMPANVGREEDPTWTAPASWAVEQAGEENETLVEDSSSDGEDTLATPSPSMKAPPNGSVVATKKRRRRVTPSTSGKGTPDRKQPYKFRIYRANNTYHVASIALNSTVSILIPYLNQKLLFDPEREKHRLYLKERGRERILELHEKPANIVRKRLMEAGYEEADGLQFIGMEDIQYLMKFVYKSNVLGRTPNDEELQIDNCEIVDLSGRGLKTVPVKLYPHADAIVLLSLSRNPMLDIPLDFIQACSSLRELRLSMMAMKKVPSSIRECKTLHRLDLSSNRITDLEDAGLDSIPSLRVLKLQNNGMEKLPWYFPRLRSLTELNISNNKFSQLPEVVCRIPSLIDLDISFNSIVDLPDEIGNLVALEKLVMVGNEVGKLPPQFSALSKLEVLDCRRNNIQDITAACLLPSIDKILADHNALHALELAFGPSLHCLVASHNDITQLMMPGPAGHPFALHELDISHAKLSSLDDLALSQLTTLHTLKVDHNLLRALPDSIGELTQLRHLSCSNNQLYALPSTIENLQKLERLEVHNNSIAELPVGLWECSSLCVINMTSNLLGTVHEPDGFDTLHSPPSGSALSPSSSRLGSYSVERKTSAAGTISGRSLPALAYSLEKLYLGENRLTEDSLHPLTLLRGLKVLNLSFNDIQVIPQSFLRNLTHLEELYLSGNKLTALPTEDLPSLTNLKSLFLNGNRLQSLPQELGKIQGLSILDVGSNLLKYNTANWEFDWNWNFNLNLRYLNLSGNKRLEIKPDHKATPAPKGKEGIEKNLADFSRLQQLKILGLMDVTTTFVRNIPDDNEDRRVRTSLSEVNNMAYGIADTLGGNLSMFDLVQPAFRNRKDEAVFAMFGRASHIGSNNRLAKYLHDHFLSVFSEELDKVEEDQAAEVHHAIRRAFLKLNKYCHDFLYDKNPRRPSAVSLTAHGGPTDMSSFKSGASGVVLYFRGTTLYVANAGNALAVVSRQGNAELLSRKHDPFDKAETHRIRQAEGWVSPKGYLNDDIDVSRSFGFYFLFPVVNARPDITIYSLTELDEFVIIGNRGLWDFVSYQTAVDIARTERNDPMIAAQKLRDFAISYGAEGTTMIMVISVADLLHQDRSRSRQPTIESLDGPEPYLIRRRKDVIIDRGIQRLEEEVPAPQGHLTLVFTDIRNSTHLWECNSGMPSAINVHNNLLRRQLRFCGGYEVKTEGDAFMCSFPTAMAALWWCLTVQVQLLTASWPLEILECEDGKEIYDESGKLIARGLSVRMGIHCGTPMSDPDPTTHRMDYLGPVVNRTARISGSAAGGQIMCSADIIREINASIYGHPATEHTHEQSSHAVDAIRRMGLKIVPVGEVKLKGLEMPESLSLVYPVELAGRHDLETLQSNSDASGSRVQFSVEQMRELAMLCIRLETLSSGRVFRPLPPRKGSATKAGDDPRFDLSPVFLYGNPDVLLPTIDKASDNELMLLLDLLSSRIENALAQLTLKHIITLNKRDGGDVSTRRSGGGLDVRILQQLLSLMPSMDVS